MLEQICAFIHNYFQCDRYAGQFEITGGALINAPPLVNGQYFRICGSRCNDGVYLYPTSDLTDEVFDGVVWDMRPPKAFLTLVQEIEDWQDKYGEAVNAPYQSESFGGYSYSLRNGGTNGSTDSDAASWQGIFNARLNQWRKIC